MRALLAAAMLGAFTVPALAAPDCSKPISQLNLEELDFCVTSAKALAGMKAIFEKHLRDEKQSATQRPK